MLDINLFSPRPSVQSISLVGAVVIFAGGEKARNEALQWAEYHHIIGIQHIWLYVNEHWEYKDYADDFDKPYISWIPYDPTMRNYPGEPLPRFESVAPLGIVAMAMNDAFLERNV